MNTATEYYHGFFSQKAANMYGYFVFKAIYGGEVDCSFISKDRNQKSGWTDLAYVGMVYPNPIRTVKYSINSEQESFSMPEEKPLNITNYDVSINVYTFCKRKYYGTDCNCGCRDTQPKNVVINRNTFGY